VAAWHAPWPPGPRLCPDAFPPASVFTQEFGGISFSCSSFCRTSPAISVQKRLPFVFNSEIRRCISSRFFQILLLPGNPLLTLFELLQDFQNLFLPLAVELFGAFDLLEDGLVFFVGLDFETFDSAFFTLSVFFFQVLLFVRRSFRASPSPLFRRGIFLFLPELFLQGDDGLGISLFSFSISWTRRSMACKTTSLSIFSRNSSPS